VPLDDRRSPTTCARSSPASSMVPMFLDFKPGYAQPDDGLRPRRARRPRCRLYRQQRPDQPEPAPPRPRNSSSSATRAARRSSSAEHHRLHGRRGERSSAGVIKHGSKMIQAVANCTRAASSPWSHRRQSFGAGNYGMCGRGSTDPRFIFAWPNSEDRRDGRRRPRKVHAKSLRPRQALKRAGQAGHPKCGRHGGQLDATRGLRRSSIPRQAIDGLSTPPPACGTTASSTRATRASCSASGCSTSAPRRGAYPAQPNSFGRQSLAL
jgi:hypothetical protein